MVEIFDNICARNTGQHAWVLQTALRNSKPPAHYVAKLKQVSGRTRSTRALPEQLPPPAQLQLPPPAQLPPPPALLQPALLLPPAATDARASSGDVAAPGADPLLEPAVQELLAAMWRVLSPVHDRASLWVALRSLTPLLRAARAASPALSAAVQQDRARAPLAVARAVMAGAARLKPLIARALGEDV
jgi:hypothetical protein